MRALLWALSGAVLLPLLLLQGRRARRDTPRLPEARGNAHGIAPVQKASDEKGSDPVSTDSEPLRLTVIGESPVAGVGVETYEEGIAAQLAACLAQRMNRPVRWQAIGENGINAAGVLERLVPKLEACDIAVVALGVNDTTGFTPLGRWRAQLRAIIGALRQKCAGPIVLAGVPPMGRFIALPQPLRWWIGLRASMLDAEARRIAASLDDVIHAPVPPLVEPDHLATDGYHPSAAGCLGWAQDLARRL